MKILVTGFKPFLGEKINPSEKLAEELSRSFNFVESSILPVEFGKSFEILNEKIRKTLPDYVIMIGQASGRACVCLEKIGLNWVQTENADEAGQIPKSGKIESESELALMSTFPIDQVFAELKKSDYPIEISFSAGTFVCNDLYFRVLNQFPKLQSVFVHVPLLPEQTKENESKPNMEFSKQLDILKRIILVRNSL